MNQPLVPLVHWASKNVTAFKVDPGAPPNSIATPLQDPLRHVGMHNLMVCLTQGTHSEVDSVQGIPGMARTPPKSLVVAKLQAVTVTMHDPYIAPCSTLYSPYRPPTVP